MALIVIPEYGRIDRAPENERALERLRRFDQRQAQVNGTLPVFDWSRRDYVQAGSFVGVVQVPGMTVEILPKVDGTKGEGGNFVKDNAQNNLLYMLSLTRKIPVEERDLAALARQRMPLLDALIRIFVERLFAELLRGLDHAYFHREENLPRLKGKLLMTEQVRRNVADWGRHFVAYDEFVSDTWLNRIIKATCRQLLDMTSLIGNQKRLRETLVLLEEISDVQIASHHFDKVHLTRNTERFRTILDFCRMVLLRQSPLAKVGPDRSFSLLLPMEKLFEEFIAAFIRKHASHFGLAPAEVHPQARNRLAYLVRKGAERKFQLRPDIVIDGTNGNPRLIIDTKWKYLMSDIEDSKNGVPQADMYQLYAYATRYRCPDNILLFPHVDGVEGKCYTLDNDERTSLRVCTVSLNRDLLKSGDRKAFLAELRERLWPQ